MKRRLEESINRKHLNIQSKQKQKIGPQTMKWLKENPGFEQTVIAKISTLQKRKIKRARI